MPWGFRESPLFPVTVNCRTLLLFIISCGWTGPGLSSSLQWTDCKPIILGVRSGEPHPSQALCQSFPEAGPISAVAGSQGSGGGGT